MADFLKSNFPSMTKSNREEMKKKLLQKTQRMTLSGLKNFKGAVSQGEMEFIKKLIPNK